MAKYRLNRNGAGMIHFLNSWILAAVRGVILLAFMSGVPFNPSIGVRLGEG